MTSMESSSNLPAVHSNNGATAHDHDEKESSDERPELYAMALAALRRARMKANGNVKKTRMATEAVSCDSGDSKILETLRLEKRPLDAPEVKTPEPSSGS